MQKIARRVFNVVAAAGFVAVLSATVAACASAPSVPLRPDELDGAKYKLVVVSGRMDGRVVQFRKKGNGYLGVIVDKGRFLTELVGVPDNMETFRLTPVAGAENSYEGVYITFQGDGSRSENEVKVNFFKDNIVWNLESATWERVQD